ncbi:NlpC/P60 family protein [Balneolales bacterium ANBcel1]|nr:NlpC/P60 family protein [Balneolales bacterium ANBcel1]
MSLIIGCWLVVSCGSPRGAVDPETRLIQHFQRWEGTPYRLGGSTRQGIDCSAFVQIVMSDAFGISLPRTTREQLEFGSRVNPRSARLGDLVFFQTGRTTFHVGIMMRGDFFMHASTSRGVTIDRLSEPYWQQRMIQVRRVAGR